MGKKTEQHKDEMSEATMTLTPWDMFVIQTAIERYEKAFLDRPSPSPAEALAWYANQSGIESRPGVARVTIPSRGLGSRALAVIRIWFHKIVLPIWLAIVPHRVAAADEQAVYVKGADGPEESGEAEAW
jgi:hypothetical protein